MNLDATFGSHPIIVKVETPDQITEIFDGITYNKGASIIRMLEDYVGPENFKNGVTSYLNAHAYGNADANDLLGHIMKVSGDDDVSGIMDTWLSQRGYPVVNVKKVDDTTYRLTQKRFLTDPNNEGRDPEPSPYK
jgi:glutamyl aminopeptidase